MPPEELRINHGYGTASTDILRFLTVLLRSIVFILCTWVSDTVSFYIMMLSRKQLHVKFLDEEEAMLLAAAYLQLESIKKAKRPRKRSIWVRNWLQRRVFYGQYEKLLAELIAEDVRGFSNYTRISPELFHELMERVGPRLSKDTFMRKALEPGHRLAITLRYMASGDSYTSLSYNFRVAHNTISKIIPETCEAIIQEYLEEVMTCPSTPEEWKLVAQSFSEMELSQHVWAIDGKHVAIKCPPNGGSMYFN